MRMNVNLVIILWIGCVFCLPCSGNAENKKNKKSTNISNELPFDSEADKFSENNLNNAKTIYSAYLNKVSKFTKSEYESSEDFKKRIENICDEPLVGKLKFCDTVGFWVLKKNAWPNAEKFKYDADTKQLIIKIFTVYGENFSAAGTDESVVSKRTYTASNAYNKKVKVEATIYDNYGLDYEIKSLNYENKIAMTALEAIEMKKWGAVIFVGKLEYPFIKYEEKQYEPKISAPYDSLHRLHFVNVTPSEVWIVNRKTGKVYIKDKLIAK